LHEFPRILRIGLFRRPMGVTGETEITLALPGDLESVRPRVAAAVERLGYRVTGENPLQARCKSSGWGIFSNTIRDYPRRLAVRLKRAGEGSTVAIFEYTIDDNIPPAGWRYTVKREAELIVAVATHSLDSTQCTACGTLYSVESRFCRQCGAPVSIGLLPQTELLRLTSEIEGARLSVILGGSLGAALFAAFIILLLSGAGVVATIVVATIMAAVTGSGFFYGFRRLNRALKPTPSEQAPPLPGLPAPPPLPRLPGQPSVSETTTELLESQSSSVSSGRDTA
jgi:hypothetical protein